jgi:ABC-type multidrug transport system permease subunit
MIYIILFILIDELRMYYHFFEKYNNQIVNIYVIFGMLVVLLGEGWRLRKRWR